MNQPTEQKVIATPPIRRALLSVSDKSGLVDFARGLAAAGVELLSTGGTRATLAEAGLPVTDVAEYTGFPEMLDGRVKTLHPKIHGGILCRHDNADDMRLIAEHGISPIELVVVNLYPFRETVAKPGVTVDEAIEKIDIGGPSMVRSAAKNHAFVTIASSPSQYAGILEAVNDDGGTTHEFRRRLAGAAFAQTAAYDTAIAAYFAKLDNNQEAPVEWNSRLTKKTSLRYGENPHQAAALYVDPSAGADCVANAEQLNGKELSYNNLLDLDAAWAIARSLPTPGVAVLKHNNPCGAATAATLGEATEKAWAGDPVSAFGSILGFNVAVDAAAAECLVEPGKFVEAIIAPDFTPEAVKILTTKPKWKANVRLMRMGVARPGTAAMVARAIDGGALVQQQDDLPDEPSTWETVTEAKASDQLTSDLALAWAVCRHVKSNAIVLVRDGMVVGVGAGQMSRIDAVEIALRKAGERSQGAVLASDAFFPFDDSIDHAARCGVAAVIQPGGSMRDNEVIAACNRHQLPMIFTGRRHFRH